MLKLPSFKDYKEQKTSNWINKNINKETLPTYDQMKREDAPISFEERKTLIDNPNWFPCVICGGRKGRRFTGVKFGQWEDCKSCDATGEYSKERFTKCYETYIRGVQEYEDYNNKIRNSILEKLTQEEIDWIKDEDLYSKLIDGEFWSVYHEDLTE